MPDSFLNYSKKLLQTPLIVSVPEFKLLVKERDEWEKQYIADGVMTSDEKLSLKETQEIYDYAIQLLINYIEQWGVTKYFNILGQFNGQKGGNYIAPKHYRKRI